MPWSEAAAAALISIAATAAATRPCSTADQSAPVEPDAAGETEESCDPEHEDFFWRLAFAAANAASSCLTSSSSSEEELSTFLATDDIVREW